MRYLKRLVWAAGVAGVIAFTATPGFAQQGGGGGGGTGGGGGGGGLGGGGTGGGGTGGGGTGGGGLGGGGTGGGGLGGGGGGTGGGGAGGGGLGGSALTGTTLMGMEAAPSITAPGAAGAGSSVIDASNIFANTFGNPQFQGLVANKAAGPGGFGSPLFGTTGGGTGGAAGGRNTGGRAGQGGQRGGMGGMGGANGGNSGIVVQLPVQISYPAVARFAAPPVAPTQLQADISGMIARSAGAISNPAGVQVLTNGNIVILRGAVKDEDEARLIEGMVRLTPGLGGLQSELTYPKQ